MISDQLKDLWIMRFNKILQMEKDSFAFYQSLLQKYEKMLDGTPVKMKLEKLMKEEARHIRLAKNLLQTLEGKQKTDSQLFVEDE